MQGNPITPAIAETFAKRARGEPTFTPTHLKKARP